MLRPYLEQALDMADEERATWLASIRILDPALAAQVASLLQEHNDLAKAGFLEGSPTYQRAQPGWLDKSSALTR